MTHVRAALADSEPDHHRAAIWRADAHGRVGCWTPRFNIQPAKTVETIGDEEIRCLMQMRWSLISSRVKDPAINKRR